MATMGENHVEDPHTESTMEPQLEELNSEGPWEEVHNKNAETIRTKEKNRSLVKQRLLDRLWSKDGNTPDIGALCSKYMIPVRIHGDHGDVYDRTEEELRQEIEAKLEEERNMAWLAENQAIKELAEPLVRTLLSAEGISTKSEFIALSFEDLTPIRHGWGPSLCGMFAGRFPGKEAVMTLINRWNVPVKVAFHRRGWMIFSFKFAADIDKVLGLGPQAIFGIPLVLEPTPEDFDFNMKLKVDVPVWIKIPDLPLNLWNRTAIEKIATSAGTPVMVDEDTILKYTLDGPRVQIILNILEKPRKSIEIYMPNGRKFTQEIVYEHLPKYCRVCQAFGHDGDGCPGPEERERERLRKAKLNRPAGPHRAKSRDPSRGPAPENRRIISSKGGPPKQRPISRGRSQGRYGSAGPSTQHAGDKGVWLPAKKDKGKGKIYKEPPSRVVTSNKFDSLSVEPHAAPCGLEEPCDDRDGDGVTDPQGNTLSFPIAITGDAYKSAIKAVDDKARKGDSPITSKTFVEDSEAEEMETHTDELYQSNAPLIAEDVPSVGPQACEEDHDVDFDFDHMEPPAPPNAFNVAVIDSFGDQEQAAFPSLQEATSGRKGRKVGIPDPTGAVSGRPPKDPGAVRKEMISKDPTRPKSRGRSKSRGHSGELPRVPSRSRSRGPSGTEDLTTGSGTDPMVEQLKDHPDSSRRQDVSKNKSRKSQ